MPLLWIGWGRPGLYVDVADLARFRHPWSDAWRRFASKTARPRLETLLILPVARSVFALDPVDRAAPIARSGRGSKRTGSPRCPRGRGVRTGHKVGRDPHIPHRSPKDPPRITCRSMGEGMACSCAPEMQDEAMEMPTVNQARLWIGRGLDRPAQKPRMGGG